MANTLLRIEHHLTKTRDALRCDIGTVREEVRGLKEGLKRKKKRYVWQSRVEIEGYSVAYFDRIAAFEAPYC